MGGLISGMATGSEKKKTSKSAGETTAGMMRRVVAERRLYRGLVRGVGATAGAESWGEVEKGRRCGGGGVKGVGGDVGRREAVWREAERGGGSEEVGAAAGVVGAAWKELGGLETGLAGQTESEVLVALRYLAGDSERRLWKRLRSLERLERQVAAARVDGEPTGRQLSKLEEKILCEQEELRESDKERTRAAQSALLALLRRQLEYHHKAHLACRAAEQRLHSATATNL